MIESMAKSSCDCYTCTDNTPLPNQGIPTNMALYNCDFSPFDCNNNNIIFNQTLNPQQKSGCGIINPQVYKDKVSPGFQTLIGAPHCNTNVCQKNYKNGIIGICPGPQVFQNDPRLHEAVRGQWITLDQAPINGSVNLNQLPINPLLDNYGQYYSSYADINAGDIQYYVDTSIQQPFFEPNFATSNGVISSVYQDPMGAIKPQYDLKSIKCDDPTGPRRNNYRGTLSFIQDTMDHRQDLMSKQMYKTNEQRYVPRYVKS